MIIGAGRPNGDFTPCDQCPLQRRPSLREFSAEELAFVKSFKVDELRVEAGASFLRQGTRIEYLYTVLSGWAFRYKMLDDGRRQIPNYALPADMLGLQGAVMNEMEHSVEALTPLVPETLHRIQARIGRGPLIQSCYVRYLTDVLKFWHH
jgi:CRP/FNR family transcriptional regulator